MISCRSSRRCQEYHAKLEARFGDESTRVGLLAGMISEAGEKWEEAEEHYAKLIERDDTSGAAMKRLIAVKIAQHKNIEAIAKLNKYLEKYGAPRFPAHPTGPLHSPSFLCCPGCFCVGRALAACPDPLAFFFCLTSLLSG